MAWEAGGAVQQQMSLQAEGLRKEVAVLIAEKTQLTMSFICSCTNKNEPIAVYPQGTSSSGL